MSSFNSALNSASTLVSLDLYSRVQTEAATEAEAVRFGKWAGLAITVHRGGDRADLFAGGEPV
ncbi:MAG: hypothetical protein R3F11_30250 [Verrucomicrobiales bacterium]